MFMKRLTLLCILVLLLLTATTFAQEIFRTGMKGPLVTTIQEYLLYLGYEIDVDGQFGLETEMAIRHFQKEHGLLVDGLVGPETQDLLKEVATTVTHIVKRGDTLQGLAKIYGTSIDAIRAANSLQDHIIINGQELVIPNVTHRTFTYVVEAGDSLSTIASKYGTTVKTIQELNQLQGDSIRIGDELILQLKEGKEAQFVEERTRQEETFTYIVEAGDSLSCIASRYSTTVRTIKELNQLQGDSIRIGEELTIPKIGAFGGVDNYVIHEITHVVQRGETLSSISYRYDVSIDNIKGANELSTDFLRVEQRLVIPDPSTNSQQQIAQGSILWPVKGQISSPFGWRNHPIYNYRQFHGGIDIVVPTGTPVKAAFSGVVVKSQWEGGFGNTVVIDHGDSIKTFYAHNSRLLVSVGDEVLKGEIIAYSGNTGISTGPHVDFRVFINGEVVDPLKWLP